MNYDQVAWRCYREIHNSTSLEMLEVAHRYAQLFKNHVCRSRAIEYLIFPNITDMFEKAYKRKIKSLTK
jgi:hypothetical protein